MLWEHVRTMNVEFRVMQRTQGRTLDNYLPERSINCNKIPTNVENKQLKQKRKLDSNARSPEKENNVPPTKRTGAKTSLVRLSYFLDKKVLYKYTVIVSGES